MQTTTYFNYRLSDDLSAINDAVSSEGPAVVNCLNPHSFVTALDDDCFRSALEKSDLLLPDGEGICMTLRRLSGKHLKKVAGDDLHRHLIEMLDAKGGRVFYMGSRDEVLERIAARLHKEHPKIQAAYHSPSYGPMLAAEESQMLIEKIKAFAPDVLFVGMTAPKQEKWVEQYRHQLEGVRIVANIGAVFDFYAGTVRRAPQWAIRLKLEWLVRLVKEPRRMWKRNFKSTPRFLMWVYRHRKEVSGMQNRT